jgi:hypothetical protein
MRLLAATVTSTSVNNYLAVFHSSASLLWRHTDDSAYLLGRCHYVNEVRDASHCGDPMKISKYETWNIKKITLYRRVYAVYATLHRWKIPLTLISCN